MLHRFSARAIHREAQNGGGRFGGLEASYALSPLIARTTASVTCSVVALPPRSGVCSEGSAVTFSIAPHEPVGGGFLPKVFQHHGGGPKGADRVGDALAGDVER